MITIIVFLLILSVLVFIHELGHFIAAKKNDIYVEEFGLGLPPRLFGIKIGETLYSINLLPFGGFVKLLGEEQQEITSKIISDKLKKRTFAGKSHLVQTVVITAGVLFNFLLGWVIISYLFTRGVPVPTERITIENVMKGSPAQKVGLMRGDELISIYVDNKTYLLNKPDELTVITKKNAGSLVQIKIQREGNKKIINVTPREHPPKNEGPLGIVITQVVIKKYPWFQAPFAGLVESARISYLIVRELGVSLFKLVTFQQTKIEVAGPIGIAKYTSQAIKFGQLAVLQLMGLLSLNLAVINILPFPALDGGKLAIIIYEAVSHRKINPRLEARLNLIGISILLGLIFTITLYEIKKYEIFGGLIKFILKGFHGA